MLFLTAFTLILLGVLPSFAWLVFFTWEDCHPEPRRLIVYTFFSGLLITFFVLQGQVLVNKWFMAAGIGMYSVTALIVLTVIEEIAKFLAAFWVIHGRPEFDEPVDAMIYMVVAALGFAAVENIALVFRAVTEPSFTAGAIEITALRFVGATLLHALASAIVGYYWGKSMKRRDGTVRFIVWGLIVASILHALFNYLILNVNAVIWSVLFLVVVAASVFRDFETFHDSPKEKI